MYAGFLGIFHFKRRYNINDWQVFQMKVDSLLPCVCCSRISTNLGQTEKNNKKAQILYVRRFSWYISR